MFQWLSNLFSILFSVLNGLFQWFYNGLFMLFQSMWTAMFGTIQTLVAFSAVVVTFLLGGFNLVLDFILYHLINSAWLLLGTFNIDYATLEQYVTIGGKTLYLMETYFGILELFVIISFYYIACAQIWFLRLFIKLIPLIG